MTGNGSYDNLLKLAWKNSWNHITWIYFWLVLDIWKHCAILLLLCFFWPRFTNVRNHYGRKFKFCLNALINFFLMFISKNLIRILKSFPKILMFLTGKLHLNAHLTLIGMRQGTFHPLILFRSDFVSWIWSKNSKLFWRLKLTSIGLIWHPVKLIDSYKRCSRI